MLGAVVGLVARTVLAQAPPPPLTDEAAATHKAMIALLGDVQKKYGADAVMFEGHLLGHAVRSGSILAAEVSVPGFEERAGKRYLTFKIDTGIVYNDRDVDAPSRPARVWSDIIEATLRKFRTLTLPADGVAVRVGYTHKPYADEDEVRAHATEDSGTPETVVYFLLLADVSELIAERLTGQQLLDRSAVLVNDAAARLVLPLPTPTP